MAHYNLDTERYEFNSVVSIEDIKEYFRYHNNSGPFFSMFETGLDNMRFDLIRIDPIRQHIRIFEFKSCRADFLSDKKYYHYLKYCHTFTFVCPREAIRREDLPKNIGLMWIYKWRHKNRLKGYDDWMLESEWVKRPRKMDVEKDVVTQIAFMLVHRVKWRKDDVF